jgi:hypothetical protein
MRTTAARHGRVSRHCAIAIAVIAFAGRAWSDVLVLKDGRRVEGTLVYETTDKVAIETRGGKLEFSRSEVASIERAQSKDKEYAARKAQAKTAEDFFQLGVWAEKNKLNQDARKCMLRAIELDPAHAGAHAWLGHVQYKDEWMTPAQRDARMAKDLEDEMLARGLVRWEDRWVSPEERDHLANGEVLENGKWMTIAERNRLHGLEEYAGRWIPRAEATARTDVDLVAKIVEMPLVTALGDDAIVAGTYPEIVLQPIVAGLKRGRAWFDRVFRAPPGLELFGGRLAELYVFDSDAPYLASIAHFNTQSRTLPAGWADAVRNTHGFFFADPFPLSSARLWHRPQDDLVGHCYHHWGHLLVARLGYDGRLLPPWYEEGVAALLEFRSHDRNAVFCRGRASVSEVAPEGPRTGPPGAKREPTTRAPTSRAAPKVGADFDPKDMRDGRWKAALKAGLAAGEATPFAELVTRQFTELDSADIAAAMGIVEWLESKDALRAFHDALRKNAPPSPLRVIENNWERESAYEKAFQAAVKMGWKDADRAWREWLLNPK